MRQSCNAVSRSGGVITAALSALVATVALGVLAAPAHAHEEREAGDFILDVGWAEEPAFTGTTNRVQLTVTDKESGDPVTDVGDGLEVEVAFGEGDGGEQITLPLAAQFTEDSGPQGEYGADIQPTRPGIYSFRIFGSIGDAEIDEIFTAGPDTFEEVREPTDIQFPASELTVSQLNERLDRELGRLSEAPEDAENAGNASAAGDSDSGDSGAGTVLGIVGIVFGTIGIAGAGVALRRSRALA